MLLSVIIVNYNGVALLDRCLCSLFKYPPSCSFEVIVVDNGSSDDSLALAKEKYPQVKVFILNHNLGFSRANNVGIMRSSGKYILLLNNDTTVCPQSLDRLVSFAQRTERLGMVGPRLLNPDGTLQQSCYDFPTVSKNFMHILNLSGWVKSVLSTGLGTKVRQAFRKRDFACFLSSDDPVRVDYVKFASVLIPREVFRKVGGLDENLFMYHEDCEFGYRLRRFGLGAYMLPTATIAHLGKGSSRPGELMIFLHFFRGLLYLFRKHKTRAAYLSLRATTAGGIVIRLLLLPLTGGRDFRIFSREKPEGRVKRSLPLLENALKGYLLVLKECLVDKTVPLLPAQVKLNRTTQRG